MRRLLKFVLVVFILCGFCSCIPTSKDIYLYHYMVVDSLNPFPITLMIDNLQLEVESYGVDTLIYK